MQGIETSEHFDVVDDLDALDVAVEASVDGGSHVQEILCPNITHGFRLVACRMQPLLFPVNYIFKVHAEFAGADCNSLARAPFASSTAKSIVQSFDDVHAALKACSDA